MEPIPLGYCQLHSLCLLLSLEPVFIMMMPSKLTGSRIPGGSRPRMRMRGQEERKTPAVGTEETTLSQPGSSLQAQDPSGFENHQPQGAASVCSPQSSCVSPAPHLIQQLPSSMS